MKAQSNIRKFFKKVASMLPKALSPKDIAPEAINKPTDQLTQERTKKSTAKHETHYNSPRFESQQLAKLKRERKIKARMQKMSRRINFGIA